MKHLKDFVSNNSENEKHYYVVTFDHTSGGSHLETMIEEILKLKGNDLELVTKTTIQFWTMENKYKNFKSTLSKIEELNYFMCLIATDKNRSPYSRHKNSNDDDIKSFKKKLNEIKKRLNEEENK